MTPLLLHFPADAAFAAALTTALPCERAAVAWRHFPDGESLVRIDARCDARDVVLVATLRDPDPLALPLRFAAATARELGARRVGLVAPYLAYMRQDKRFHPGEAVSSVHFARFLEESFDWLATVDPHLHRHATLAALFRMPARAVSAMPAIAAWIAAQVPRPVLIGPDAESAQWVERVAALAGAPSVVLRKHRRGDRDVEVSVPDPAALAGRTPVLVDDIVSSGRTAIETLLHLRRLGCAPATLVAVHGLFADDAEAALRAAGAGAIVTCNTIAHATNAIDVATGVADAVGALIGVNTALPHTPTLR